MGWLLRSDDHEKQHAFEVGAAGRPIVPRVLLKDQPLDACQSLKMLALQWAKEWLEIKGEIIESDAVYALNLSLVEGHRDLVSDEERILLVASRALYRWHDAARLERTKRAFPWLRFVSIAGKRNCQRAETLNGHLLAFEDHEELPLQDCNAEDCNCIYLQVTEGQRQRMIARNNSNRTGQVSSTDITLD